MRFSRLLCIAGALLLFSAAAFARDGSHDLMHAKIIDLHPGQCDVGFKEVEIKLNHFLAPFDLDLREYRRLRRENPNGKKMKEILSSAHFENFLSLRTIEVVRDPMGEFHIVDGHHLALTLRRLGVEWTEVEVRKDFLPGSEKLTPSELAAAMKKFEAYMKENNFVRLIDPDGATIKMCDLPGTVDDLINSPFRSLAWLLKKGELFDDMDEPFQEFEWAEFLKEQFEARGWKTDFSSDEEFFTAVNRALEIAEASRGAMKGLPGAGSFKPKRVRKACEKLLTKFAI